MAQCHAANSNFVSQSAFTMNGPETGPIMLPMFLLNVAFFLVFPSVTHVKQRMSRRFMKMTASLSVFQVHPTESQYRDYKRSGDSFWSKLEPVKVDTAKLEHLFETKSKEISVTKVKRRHLNGIFEIISLSVPLYVPLLRQAQLSSCWHTAF